MIYHPETEALQTIMAGIPSGSAAQNAYLKQALLEKRYAVTDCFLLMKNNVGYGRAVLMENYMSFLTLEPHDNVNYSELFDAMKSKRTFLETHIYDSKTNYQFHLKCLEMNDFKCTQQKISARIAPKQCSYSLRYQETTKDDPELVKVVQAGMTHSLDRVFQQDVSLYREKAGETYLNELDSEQDDHYLVYNLQEIVGAITLSRLDQTTLAINYIGVNTEVLGRGYGKDMIAFAQTMGHIGSYRELIADVDIENTPLLTQLKNLGFDMSSREWVYHWGEEQL